MNLDFRLQDILSYLNENLWDYLIALAIILFFYVVSRIFSLYIVRFVLFLTRKTTTSYDTKVVQAFRRPATLFFVLLGYYLAARYLLTNQVYEDFLTSVFRIVVILLVTSGFLNLVGTSSELIAKIGSTYGLDRVLLALLSKGLKLIILVLSFAFIASELQADIGAFVAGLGVGGLAFALAAQDTLSNFFGGVVILVEKPFTIGDWILAGDVEGTVEDITFRSTKVRTFAQAVVTVPNSNLGKIPVTNWTRMGRRRIMFNLGVTYTTPRHKLQNCVNRIRDMLKKHPGIHPETIFANFDKFNDSSLDIFIYCFTHTTVWGEWLAVKEDVNLKIMEILEDEDVSVALPSRSLYIETPIPFVPTKEDLQSGESS